MTRVQFAIRTSQFAIRILFTTAVLTPTAVAQTLPAGSEVEVRLDHEVSSETMRAGDPVRATFPGGLLGGGAVLVPAGSRYHGKVEHVEKHTREQEAWIRLVFHEIELSDGRRMSVSASRSFRASAPRRALEHAVAIPLGAAAGAVIGGRSARIAGALGGALAGFVFASNRSPSGGALRLRSGQILALRLSSDLPHPASLIPQSP